METWADQHPDEPTPERPTGPGRLDPRRGLPRLPIFWTLDQVAACLNLTVETLGSSYLFYMGRDVGVAHRRYLRAVNLGAGAHHPLGSDGDWRVDEGELIRWLTYHDLWVYDPQAFDFDYDKGRDFRARLRRSEHDDRIITEGPRKPLRPPNLTQPTQET